MPKGRRGGSCAVTATGSDIYIFDGETSSQSVFGGYYNCSIDVFDTGSPFTWKTDINIRDMPDERYYATSVLLKGKYLVIIGGRDKYGGLTASCFICDLSSNLWSSTPKSMDMIKARLYHTAEVLDGKIVVFSGSDQFNENILASMEFIEVDALLEYSPLHYPLPSWIFKRILEIGKV
uniref:Uncharacterized protein n=1 Tax=Leptocylindrus danicus TaxID=163516 RepID=A0A7S2KXD3_9STRA|mmetsp:Transcript_28487/g.41920  ORF Transcript_28487/g.41920 Transcript_28487/m.41920 type:complete len:178 (+) Transcript_28487:219-752(+)